MSMGELQLLRVACGLSAGAPAVLPFGRKIPTDIAETISLT